MPPNNDGRGDRQELPCGSTRKSSFRNKNDGTADGTKVKEDEIKRLTAERNKLLQTGAYNNYDSVVRELEKRMVALAQGQM